MNISPLQLFKALADDTRLKCLLLIKHEAELCVCELMSGLQVSQPKISRHLAQLRTAGLLIDRRQGQWVFYSLNPKLAPWVRQILSETLNNNAAYIEENLRQLTDMGERPARQRACCP